MLLLVDMMSEVHKRDVKFVLLKRKIVYYYEKETPRDREIRSIKYIP